MESIPFFLVLQPRPPLRAIRDNHPKTLLTLDEVFGEMDYDGIRKTNLIRWLEE